MNTPQEPHGTRLTPEYEQWLAKVRKGKEKKEKPKFSPKGNK